MVGGQEAYEVLGKMAMAEPELPDNAQVPVQMFYRSAGLGVYSMIVCYTRVVSCKRHSTLHT